MRIRRSRSGWGGTPGADTGLVTITLATRTLRSARLIGPATLQVDGARGLNLHFSVEGSGRLRATGVAADTLALGLLGSGALGIAGTADVLRGDFQGTGNVEAARLVAGNATVTTNTSGTVALTVNGPAAITANGLGEVTILGGAICTLAGPGTDQVRCAQSQISASTASFPARRGGSRPDRRRPRQGPAAHLPPRDSASPDARASASPAPAPAPDRGG